MPQPYIGAAIRRKGFPGETEKFLALARPPRLS